ncbi:15089_t:CDS:2 [Dentiscutata erythropus]|uniref:15089_t:CDS:1 n=1 Tax=Dentiscutata erythropus TaxID=1348616 RepID=A0A9N9DT16_9GLOM|nr:15089_t:CDS:2 [Dentiscutata erythropus]
MSGLRFLQLQNTNVEKLLNDLNSSYKNKKFSDTKIIVGKEGKTETIYANYFILKIRSEYFQSALSKDWNFNASYNMKTLLDTFSLMYEMGIMVLRDGLKSYFIENIITIMKSNLLLVLEFIKKFILYDDLKEVFLKALCLNPVLLFNFGNKEIHENILHELISRSELCLEENLLLSRMIQWLLDTNGFPDKHDGLKSETFHKNCDRKGPTIVIIKLLDGDLIGGYNPLDWEGENVWKKTSDSFLFQKNRHSYKKVNIKPGSEGLAIHCGTVYGPTFGRNNLCIQNGSGFCIVKDSQYESLSVSGRFQIASYEVLRVIKQR